MPYISGAILFQGAWLQSHSQHLPSYASNMWDPDMAFSAWMREEVGGLGGREGGREGEERKGERKGEKVREEGGSIN